MESRVFHARRIHCTIPYPKPEGVVRTLCGIDVHANEAPHPYVDPVVFNCGRYLRIVLAGYRHD